MRPKIEIISAEGVVNKTNKQQVVHLRMLNENDNKHIVSTIALSEQENIVRFMQKLFSANPKKIKNDDKKEVYRINFI